MFPIHCPVQVLKSTLLVSLDAPYLGASPDGKVLMLAAHCLSAFQRSRVLKQNSWLPPRCNSNHPRYQDDTTVWAK